MGRIKGTLVKRTTKELIKKYPERFNDKFEDNKKAVIELVPSHKKLRNSIAGYAARVMRMKKAEKI